MNTKGRCWLGLDKGKPRESAGHKATDPSGKAEGGWAAEGQMRDTIIAVHRLGPSSRSPVRSIESTGKLKGVPQRGIVSPRAISILSACGVVVFPRSAFRFDVLDQGIRVEFETHGTPGLGRKGKEVDDVYGSRGCSLTSYRHSLRSTSPAWPDGRSRRPSAKEKR